MLCRSTTPQTPTRRRIVESERRAAESCVSDLPANLEAGRFYFLVVLKELCVREGAQRLQQFANSGEISLGIEDGIVLETIVRTGIVPPCLTIRIGLLPSFRRFDFFREMRPYFAKLEVKDTALNPVWL